MLAWLSAGNQTVVDLDVAVRRLARGKRRVRTGTKPIPQTGCRGRFDEAIREMARVDWEFRPFSMTTNFSRGSPQDTYRCTRNWLGEMNTSTSDKKLFKKSSLKKKSCGLTSGKHP